VTSVPAPSARRDDIQGLRALCAVLIVGFHAWTERTSGGVDVFFVVSGFLLIGSLARQTLRAGTVDLQRFAVGISRRLLPAIVVVTVITVVVSQILLPGVFWDRAIREGLATSLFVENLALQRYAVDYLARGDIPTPFNNGWAISLQVQAYVLIGLLMAGLALWAHRTDRRVVRLALGLAVVTLASFAWAARAVVVDPTGAYFDPLARLWEFTVGGLLALGLTRRGLPDRLRGPAGWTGLALLLTTGPLWGTTSLFPAWASLWPATAALLILAAGADGRFVGAGQLLAWRPLAWLGDRSYGLYLWQGPVLVFLLVATGRTDADLATGLLILTLSIGLAAFSKATLEKPLTAWLSADRSFARIMLRAALLVTVMVAAVGLWALHLSHARQVQRDQLATTRLTGRPPRVLGQTVIVPGPIVARDDQGDMLTDGCLAGVSDQRLLSCRYGATDAPVLIALVGSSHARHWLPALQQIAATRGWRIVTYTKAVCSFGTGANDNFGRPAPDCAAWSARVTERLLELRPDLVVTVATLNRVPPEQLIPPGHWRQLGAAGIPVLGLRDTPWFDHNMVDCVARSALPGRDCSVPRRDRDPAGLVPAGGWPSNFIFVETRDWLCLTDRCGPFVDGFMVYFDDSHMTATFARSLAPRLEPWIDRALRPEAVSPRPGPRPSDRSPAPPDRPGPSYRRP
jgi:peptidoglycan/LPS O-acetylase OafA/YrhL